MFELHAWWKNRMSIHRVSVLTVLTILIGGLVIAWFLASDESLDAANDTTPEALLDEGSAVDLEVASGSGGNSDSTSRLALSPEKPTSFEHSAASEPRAEAATEDEVIEKVRRGGVFIELLASDGSPVRSFGVSAVDRAFPLMPASWGEGSVVGSGGTLVRGGATHFASTTNGECHVPWLGVPAIGLLVHSKSIVPTVFDSVESSPPEAPAKRVRLQLAQVQAGSVSGRVIHDDGSAVADATVIARMESPVDYLIAPLSSWMSVATARATSNKLGRFEIRPWISSGRYSLGVEIDGQTIHRTPKLEAKSGEKKQVVIRLPPVRYLTVEVRMGSRRIKGAQMRVVLTKTPRLTAAEQTLWPAYLLTQDDGMANIMVPTTASQVAVTLTWLAHVPRDQAARNLAGTGDFFPAKNARHELIRFLIMLLGYSVKRIDMADDPVVKIDLLECLEAMPSEFKTRFSRRIKEAAQVDTAGLHALPIYVQRSIKKGSLEAILGAIVEYSQQ